MSQEGVENNMNRWSRAAAKARLLGKRMEYFFLQEACAPHLEHLPRGHSPGELLALQSLSWLARAKSCIKGGYGVGNAEKRYSFITPIQRTQHQIRHLTCPVNRPFVIWRQR